VEVLIEVKKGMKIDTGIIRKKILFVGIMAFLVLCLVFFLPARTFRYWEAWIYMGIIFSCASGVVFYFLKHDPELLERRIRTKEKVKEQKLIIAVGWLIFLPIFLIPGFDKYYNWSEVPLFLKIIADIFVLAGYLIVIRVFRENSYTSRVIEVDSGQRVISTGPYAIVRHPMYAGNLLMYGFTPVALGSWWALIGSVLLVILILFRIFSEEKFLIENLEGYKDYLHITRYRLIPGIW
jgi:protein-S-isoprenylcysteine O-methyltransferase Ste14